MPTQPAELAPLSEGDTVTWTHIRPRRSGADISTRKGKVVRVYRLWADVRYRGQIQAVRRDRLRLEGQRSELTEALLEMAST